MTKPVHTTTSNLPISHNSNFNTNKPQPKTTIQKLSQSQIQARREKGLCFYCDKKCSFGRKCKTTVHILITPDSEENPCEELNDNEQSLSDEEVDQGKLAAP